MPRLFLIEDEYRIAMTRPRPTGHDHCSTNCRPGPSRISTLGADSMKPAKCQPNSPNWRTKESHMPAVQTALVIGGGIAGPVAATALTMAGIDAAVYEARPSDPSSANGIGGSLALEPNGLAALRIVGADDDVRAAAVPITRSIMSIASKPGREMPTPQGLPPRQLIDRGALHRILRDRAERAGVRIQDGKKLIRVDEGTRWRHRPFRRRQQRQRRRTDRRRRRALDGAQADRPERAQRALPQAARLRGPRRRCADTAASNRAP